jgi:hypothetical protein
MNTKVLLILIVSSISWSAEYHAQTPAALVASGYTLNLKKLKTLDCDTCISYEFDFVIAETVNGEAWKDNMLSLPRTDDTLHSLHYTPKSKWDSLWNDNKRWLCLSYDSTQSGLLKVKENAAYGFNFYAYFNCDTVYWHHTFDRNKTYWEVTKLDDWEISKQYDYNRSLLFIHEEKCKDFELWKIRSCGYKNGKKSYVSRTRTWFGRHRYKQVTWEFKDEGHFCLHRYVKFYIL